MRIGIGLLLLLTAVTSCASQPTNKRELVLLLEKNINRIEFSKLAFLTKELIELSIDTNFQSKFRKKLDLHNSVKRKTEGDQKEYRVSLDLLYNKLAAQKDIGKEYESGKKFLLAAMSEKRVKDFAVNEELIIQQLDARVRSMVNGYDEGSVQESSFIFFCYDPMIHKKVLLKNPSIGDWKKTGIFLCNYLRQNENPIAIRIRIRDEIIKELSRKEIQPEFKDILKYLAECDVSSNLFD